MAYNGVRTYTKPHTDNNGSGSNTTIITGEASNNYDTQNLNVININAQSADINNLKARNIKTDNIDTEYIRSTNADIDYLNGTTVNYNTGVINNLNSNDIDTKNITVHDTANIDTIINNNLSSKSISTDFLTVNKQAHFFELIVDKMRSVEGTQINTAANCVADYVEWYDSNDDLTDDINNVAYFRIYWRNKDDEGHRIDNEWLVNDQAICQSFNLRSNQSYNISSKYYWRLVKQVGSSVKYVNLNPKYTGYRKVSDSSINSYSIKFDDLEYTTSQDTFTDFTGEALYGGSWLPNTKFWTIKETTNTLKLYNQDYCLNGGTLSFTTKYNTSNAINTSLNIIVVYDDGTVEYHNSYDQTNDEFTYQDTYSVTTQVDKNVDYFLITSNEIQKWDACNWIDLGNVNTSGQPKEYDDDPTHNPNGASSIPTIGDNICQLGYRYTSASDKKRASAIIIASYETPDDGITPPSYAQYQDITDFNLSTHRKTFFDANGGTVIGNFKVDTGTSEVDLDQYIQSQTTIQEAEILIEANNAEIDMCLFQVDNADQIHDLNNFPGWTDTNGRRNLYISIYTQQQYTPIFVNCNLFGRTVTLLDIDPNTGTLRLLPTPDSGNGIYVYSVTQAATNKLCITFDFRGTDQTITNGSSVEFYGQVIINSTTYNPSKSITIASVQNGHGIDADMYMLNKLKEEAVVNGDKNLIVHLQYGIRHVVGNSTQIVPKGQYMSCEAIIYMSDNSTQTVPFLYDSTNNYFYYDDTSITNYYSWTNAVPLYYKIQLKNSNDSGTTYFIADSVLVNINLGNRSLFDVEDDMITAITTETNNRTAQYGQLSVQAGLISAHVNTIDQGLSSTGIDITNGKIELRGDDVTFTNSAGTVSGKISIDTTTGTLNAVDANLSGIFKSENTSTLYKTVIDTNNGAITLWSPKEVTSGGTPVSGTTQEKTADIGWYVSEYGSRATTIGQIRLYDANESEKMNTISAHGTWLKNKYNGINTNTDGITYEDFSDSNNNLYLSWTDLIGQRLSILRTSTINPTDLPAANTLYLLLEHSLIIVNHNWNNSNFNIYLPNATTCPGKVYFIKNRRNHDLNLYTSGSSRIIKEDNNDSFSLPLNVDRQSCIFVSDGTDWITFTDIS